MIDETIYAYYCMRCESDREDGLDVWKPVLQIPAEFAAGHAPRARAISMLTHAEVSVYIPGRPVGRDYATFGEDALPRGTDTRSIREFAENWK